MKTVCRAYVFAILIAAVLYSPASSYEGPLQVRNLYPLFLHADQQYLERAAMENSTSYSLSHSSTYTMEKSKDWTINLDMEITELSFIHRAIVKNWFEVDLYVPLLIFGKGIMDGPLGEYHDTFGFDDYGRTNRPDNEFLYEVKRNGVLIIKGKSAVKLGDIRLALKKPLISAEDHNLSLKADVEIPVSNAKKGYSNGSVDAAVSILFDKSYSDTTMTYWNLGVVFPGDVRGHERVELENFIYGGLAIESMLGKNFSALIQLHGQSNIYPDTSIAAVDGRSFMIVFGGRYFSGKRSLEFSLTEDLNTTGAPDFIINMTYKLLM